MTALKKGSPFLLLIHVTSEPRLVLPILTDSFIRQFREQRGNTRFLDTTLKLRLETSLRDCLL